MVKAVKIALLKPIFNDNESTWKSNLLYLLKDVGGSIFYSELLQWWSQFRDHLFDEKYCLSIIWNHKDIRIKE